MSSEDELSHEDVHFPGTKQLISIVVEYMSHVLPSSPHAIDMLRRLESLPGIRNMNDLDKIRNFFQELMSFGQELKVFFKVPNQQFMSNIIIPTPNPNQAVATFINFLILMVEAILRFQEGSIACVKGALKYLQTELGFLIAFLGDTGMHLQPNKNIVIDIETMVNEVGSFLYSFLFIIVVFSLIQKKGTDNEIVGIEYVVNRVRSFFYSDLFTCLEDIPLQTTVVGGRKKRKEKKKKRKIKQKKKAISNIKALVHEVRSFLDFFVTTKNDQIRESGILNLALSNLFLDFGLLKTKIKEHCTTVSNMSSDMDPKTTVVSVFIVDSVLVDLTQLLNNKSDRIVAVKDQIVTLHDELMLLGSSVMDIAVQQDTEDEELLVRTRDAAYEVEYVINLFQHVWYLTLRLPQLIEKIQLIKMEVKETRNNINAAVMTEVAKYPDELEQVLLPSKEPPILEDIVVGFDKVATEIKEQLVRGETQLQIISICGMAGLGKTTLANKLYTDPSVKYHFDKLGYCVVSQTYNKKNVLIDILSSILNQKRETIINMDEGSLVDYLYKSIKGRRYLIVMDDIWDTQSWNELKRYLPDDRTGSRILFTTRNKEVGSEASSHTSIHALPFLSKVECWELLQLKVFKGKSCPQELVDIGKQIASNCHGLPLAVVVIAAILANKEKKKNLWQQVAINSSSHMSENPENCIRILELSYKHLPMHLKPCFLYFGAFNEDMEIPVRKLIMLWVAEGYIKKEEQKCLEDVGLKYLMELIDRSLVIVAKQRSDGRVKTCKIHDLLREMCLRIAEENNFLKVVKLNANQPLPFIGQALVCQKHPCVTIYNGDFKQPILFSCSFKALTFLDYYDTLGDHPLIGIGHLVHLRYLAIAQRIVYSVLPSIDSFYKLEFLYVSNEREIEIPDVLLSMACLRHVHFRGGAYFSSNLRGYNTFKENDLQSFSVLLFRKKIAERFLRSSPNLQRLKLKVKDDFSHHNILCFLKHLESLKLYEYRLWKDSHITLISLPINLKKLTLVRFHVSPKQMKIVGRLQCLEVLKLEGVVFEGDQWDVSEDEFPELKFLGLDEIQIAEWTVSSDHFPRLDRLVLQHCKRLKMIPSSFGDIMTLKKIEVYGCAEAIKESAKKIQEEQQENGNEVLKVIILD